MKIVNNESAEIIFNEPLNSVEVYWKGYVKSELYRQILETAYDTIIEYGATQWVADMTCSGVSSTEDQKWVMNEFIPKCGKAGVQRVAIVLSKDIFAKFYGNKINTSLGEHAAFNEYFATREEAHEWLKSFI